LRKLPRKRKPQRAVAVVVVVPPLVDAEVHPPVAVDAHRSVEELEVGVPVCHRRHHRPMAPKLVTRRRKLSKSWRKTSLSRSSRHHHHPTWWT
jgi:hypothetical protein